MRSGSEDFGEAGIEAGVAGLIQGEQALAHQVVRGSGFVQVERNEGSGAAQDPVKGEGQLDATNGAAETQGVATHAFGHDDAFIEIPLLGMGGEEEHELRIFAHAAKALAAAEHEPHIGRFEGNLTFSRFEIVASYGSYALKLDPLQLGH